MNKATGNIVVVVGVVGLVLGVVFGCVIRTSGMSSPTEEEYSQHYVTVFA